MVRRPGWVWIRNPKEQESKMKRSRRNGTQRARETCGNQRLNFLTPSPLSHFTWHFPISCPKVALKQSLVKDYMDPTCWQTFHFLGVRLFHLGNGDAFSGRAGPVAGHQLRSGNARNGQTQAGSSDAATPSAGKRTLSTRKEQRLTLQLSG